VCVSLRGNVRPVSRATRFAASVCKSLNGPWPHCQVAPKNRSERGNFVACSGGRVSELLLVARRLVAQEGELTICVERSRLLCVG
jgi:hypothetical protein